MTIFDRFKAKQEQAQATARERYYALLARIDLNDTNEQDAAELETLMRDLNVSHDRALKDHAQVRQALAELEHEAKLDATAGAIAPAHDRYMQACAERQEATRANNHRVTIALGEHEQAQADHARCQQARQYLRELATADPIMDTTLRDLFTKRQQNTKLTKRIAK